MRPDELARVLGGTQWPRDLDHASPEIQRQFCENPSGNGMTWAYQNMTGRFRQLSGAAAGALWCRKRVDGA
jgi:hypothetical protein